MDKGAGLLFVTVGLAITYWLFNECWQEGQKSGPDGKPEAGKYVIWFFISALGAFAVGVRYLNACD